MAPAQALLSSPTTTGGSLPTTPTIPTVAEMIELADKIKKEIDAFKSFQHQEQQQLNTAIKKTYDLPCANEDDDCCCLIGFLKYGAMLSFVGLFISGIVFLMDPEKVLKDRPNTYGLFCPWAHANADGSNTYVCTMLASQQLDGKRIPVSSCGYTNWCDFAQNASRRIGKNCLATPILDSLADYNSCLDDIRMTGKKLLIAALACIGFVILIRLIKQWTIRDLKAQHNAFMQSELDQHQTEISQLRRRLTINAYTFFQKPSDVPSEIQNYILTEEELALSSATV